MIFRGKLRRGLIATGYLIPLLFGKDLQIIDSSPHRCEFVFIPHNIRLDTLQIQNAEYHRIEFDETAWVCNPGEPMLPFRQVYIAVPPGASVQVGASAAGFRELDHVDLMPFPKLDISDGFSCEKYEWGLSYNQPDFIPSSLFEESGLIETRGMILLPLRIWPVQYHPRLKKLRIYTRITVRVQFDGKGQDAVSARIPEEADSADRMIVNAEQARQWKRSPQKMRKYQPVFGSGSWYRIPVTENHVYQITGKTLSQLGIDLAGIQVTTLKIFNNGGLMLPGDPGADRARSLIELPVYLDDGDDGRMDDGDAIWFYGHGLTGWEWNASTGIPSHYRHFYETENVYWLTFNDGKPGKRIVRKSGVERTGSELTGKTTAWICMDEDRINPIQAGTEWVAREFTQAMSRYDFHVSLDHPVAEDSVWITARVKGGHREKVGGDRHIFTFSMNGQTVSQIQVSNDMAEIIRTKTVINLNRDNEITVYYQNNNSAAFGFLDWIEIGYHRALRAESDELFFTAPATGGTVTYQLDGFSSWPAVWDITAPANVRSVSVDGENEFWQCADRSDGSEPARYIAFSRNAIVPVSQIEKEDCQSDLRNPSNGADMIIVTPQRFLEQAERLEQLRETADTLDVMVVDIRDIINEFGWGLTDPVAIRDFMLAADQWHHPPQFLLLLGDGHYDYLGHEGGTNTNWMPVFEKNHPVPESAIASDEYFVRFNAHQTFPGLAVGRLPVQTQEEARIVVDKIVQYELAPRFEFWRTCITLVADDEVNGSSDSETRHTTKTEYLSNHTIPPVYNVRKIYLTEYEAVLTAEGFMKPDARTDLIEQINRGTLLVNYIGHGNENVFAQEQVIAQPRDLTALNNPDCLPLFFGSSCSFAHFDMTEKQCLAENLLLMEKGGAIACIGATRNCYPDQNEKLDEYFLDILLNSGGTLRVGEAFRLAKMKQSHETYVLLGDPALRPALPREQIHFQSVRPDSFKALATVHVIAEIEGEKTISGGRVLIAVYDSEIHKIYSFQPKGKNVRTIHYALPGNTLFRGETSVKGGGIDASFIVPKDIGYGGTRGRISIYAYGAGTDAAGYRNSIPVGGSSGIVDTEGPDIRIYFSEDPGFVTGGMVPSDPELVAEIGDRKTGINITGEIGHKMTLTLDDGAPEDVSAYFQYDEDSYLKGKLRYPLVVDEGEHTLTLKAWDNANNSGTEQLVFYVVPRGEL
ncbi:type IX secretion system sortase PorU, partial [bacterium]|nr:type IX secretion system sortase PorU [bacterium]